MTRRFGIDASILVRLLTGEPEGSFAHSVSRLSALVEADRAEIFASNQVVGEAYVAVQHHYGVSKSDARAGLVQVLHSGLVAPLNGSSVFTALETEAGCGLLDRLIADDYDRVGLVTLTLDRKMAALPDTRHL
jgi:predicted nucleic acid-binding protein